MSKRTVERVLHLWRTTGEVIENPRKTKHKRKRYLTDHESDVRICYLSFVPIAHLFIVAHHLGSIPSRSLFG